MHPQSNLLKSRHPSQNVASDPSSPDTPLAQGVCHTSFCLPYPSPANGDKEPAVRQAKV